MDVDETNSRRKKNTDNRKKSIFQTQDFFVPFTPQKERGSPLPNRIRNKPRSQSEGFVLTPSSRYVENPTEATPNAESISVISSNSPNEIKGIISHQPIHCANGCPCQSREGVDGKRLVSINEPNDDNSDKFPDDSGSTTWQVFRRKILIDLQRQFGKKVEHPRLISCLCK